MCRLQVTAKLLRRTHGSDSAASIVESVRAQLLQKKEVWRAGYLRCVCWRMLTHADVCCYLTARCTACAQRRQQRGEALRSYADVC